jgi:Domain of unknown function (DUF4271)
VSLKKIVKNIILFAFLIGFCANLKAQDSTKRSSSPTPVAPPQSTPSASNNGVNNPNLTVPPIFRPIDDFVVKPKPRRRKLTAADSLRLAVRRDSLMRDSMQKAMAIAANASPSAFNIGVPNPTTGTLPQTTTATPTQAATPEVPLLNTSSNPFEILRGASVSPDSASKTAINTAPQNLEQLPSALLDKKVYSKNFLFWVFMITLMLMAFVVANARSMISSSYTAIISDNAMRLMNKQAFGWGNAIYLALYALFWINGGIFAYLLMSYFGVKSPYGQTVTFLSCIGGVAMIFILKHMLLFIIAHVFPIEKEMKTYNFIVLTAGVLLGMLLMPFNVLIAYSPSGFSEVFIYLAFAIIGMVYLVRSLRSLTIAAPHMMENRFHFLLYLCTVEIAPLMVLAKIISLGMKM